MSGFSADWLRLREPQDRAARAASAPALGLGGWAERFRDASKPLEVLDLGCGLGANLRELAPDLGGPQRWRLVDHDPALLAALPAALAAWARAAGHELTVQHEGLRLRGRSEAGRPFDTRVGWQQLDLTDNLERLPFGSVQLVTASALIDLVSAPWLQRLVDHAAEARCALMLALNVDGRCTWAPTDADDALVHAAFAAHQRRDKGFGPALGPTAPAEAKRRLAIAGYRVSQAASDWLVDGRRATAMLAALIDGHAAAAAEQNPTQAAEIAAWRERRLVLTHLTQLRVGHLDLFATP